MKKIEVLKIGTECKDKASKSNGMITHWVCDMGGRIYYLFQPRGLSSEDGQTLEKLFVEPERLECKIGDFESVDVPFEILGSDIEDKASGFRGMAVSFVRYTHGCFHVCIQPSGRLKKDGALIKKAEFDLRQCKGKMIKEMTEAEIKKSHTDTPSPTNDKFERGMPMGLSMPKH